MGAAALWVAAALLRWCAVPAFERLPADYVAETSYTDRSHSHQTPESPDEVSENVVRRRDQTLTSGATHAVIQGDAHWLTKAGTLIFESLNTYGVDRRTRQNLAGFGNQDRQGQYLFPSHTAKTNYGLWDPMYGGPGIATFDRVETFRGLQVYVFNFRVEKLDETAGYSSLPDVPEKYRAVTDGKGQHWIEPVSGVIVDHVDTGVSYFVEPATGRRVGEPIHQWEARFTPETVERQFQLATTTRRQMFALGVWVPLACASAGLICLAAAFRRQCRRDS